MDTRSALLALAALFAFQSWLLVANSRRIDDLIERIKRLEERP